MDKLFDICHECKQHHCELKPPEAPFLSTTDDPRFLWLKYEILMYFEDFLKTIEKKSQRNNKYLYLIKNLFRASKSMSWNRHSMLSF